MPKTICPRFIPKIMLGLGFLYDFSFHEAYAVNICMENLFGRKAGFVMVHHDVWIDVDFLCEGNDGSVSEK